MPCNGMGVADAGAGDRGVGIGWPIAVGDVAAMGVRAVAAIDATGTGPAAAGVGANALTPVTTVAGAEGVAAGVGETADVPALSPHATRRAPQQSHPIARASVTVFTEDTPSDQAPALAPPRLRPV